MNNTGIELSLREIAARARTPDARDDYDREETQ